MATEKQLRFVAEFLKDRNASAAYQRAGYAARGNSAETAASRLLRDPEIVALIEQGEGELRERVKISQENITELLWDIAITDANDLIQHRHLCCRYCYGIGFRYQRTAGERERDFAQWEADQRDADDDDPVRPFDEMGGTGYHKLKDPNPDCPECFGEGVTDVYIPDTRKLTGAARTAYAGVQVTKDGIKVLQHSKPDALVKVGEHIGMFRKVLEHKGVIGVAEITESLTPDVKERVAKEMLREAGYVVDE
ncbi:terminase small subunit [Paraburkholderia antibiotica]|uniref:Terminase small subunit n=1 Tax=Paraburkholderia antibiotica TaxID=2728839 RepID=A0A7Y0A131_9BURK|nr:terminase small subunit [Paraburkholderia antibiotica]NML34528.1 terminase small subunit [Paraburkholderia antibiotica]